METSTLKELKSYLNNFTKPQQPKPKGFYLVDWGCNAKGARYGLIEGDTMEDAFCNLDATIDFHNDVKLQPLNSEHFAISSCYIELCDLSEGYQITNNCINDPKNEDDSPKWIKAKDFFNLPPRLRKKL